jgi:hypothetical protein
VKAVLTTRCEPLDGHCCDWAFDQLINPRLTAGKRRSRCRGDATSSADFDLQRSPKFGTVIFAQDQSEKLPGLSYQSRHGVATGNFSSKT